jgi:hypothetical protein
MKIFVGCLLISSQLFLCGALHAQPNSDPDESVAIEDSGSGEDEIRISDDDEGIKIGDEDEIKIGGEEPPAPEVEEAPPRVRYGGYLYDRFSMDMLHEGKGEDVFDNRFRANLYTTISFPAGARIFIEGDLRHFVVGETSREPPWYLFNSRNVKARHELELGEAYVYLPNRFLNLRVGNQIMRWGSGVFNKPTDVLNPTDMREGLVNDLEAPLVPVPMVHLDRDLGPVNIAGVWIPFFVQNKVNLLGQDWSALGGFAAHPGLPGAAAMGAMAGQMQGLLHPTIEDRMQPLLLASDPPPDDLTGSQLGVRMQTRVLGADVGLQYFWGWDKFPITKINQQAFELLSMTSGLDKNSPDYGKTLLEMMGTVEGLLFNDDGTSKSLTMNDLFRSHYERQHVVGGDLAAVLFNKVTLTLNGAWSPERTLYLASDAGMPAPVRKQAFSYAVGLEYHKGAWFDVMLEWYQFHVLGLDDGEELFLIDDQLSMVTAAVIVRFLEFDAMELRLSGMYEVSMRNWFFFPRLSYKFTQDLRAGAGVMMQGVLPGGNQAGPAGLFDQNDSAYLDLKWTF